MVISLITILAITFCGLSLTFLFAKSETFLWRIAAGNIVGSAVFGLVTFIGASFFGLSVVTVLGSLLIASASLLLLRDKDIKRQLKDEWQRGVDKTQGVSFKKFGRLSYYLFFLVLFVAFFDRAMITGADGIFTGASQNLGDLPFHLGAIFSFTDGNNFPPQNPSFADAKFTYPFIADFLTACLVKLGATVQSAMLAQNVTWAFSLLVVLERFVFKVTRSLFASKAAPLLLFFSGGLGFLWFLKDYWYGAQSLWELLWNIPRDYTIGDKFRWGNTLITLFITQRSLLLGMPLVIIVLTYWRKVMKFDWHNEKSNKEQTRHLPFSFAPFFVGLLAGALPLIHAHSIVVLFLVSVFWILYSKKHFKEWITFACGVSVIAIPELLWILSGSATSTREFLAWHFGWDARDNNLIIFWLKNTGVFIPLLISGLGYLLYMGLTYTAPEDQSVDSRNEAISKRPSYFFFLSLFYAPFLVIFVSSNLAKFAPWEWDNIKLLIYWFVGSIPFVGFLLASVWNRGKYFKPVAICLLVVLTFSGALDVWRVASAQMRHEVFDKDAVEIAEEIKKKTEPNALFLHAPTYNSAIVLTGRRSLLRYIGHLSSHGIDYKEREDDLKLIYSGAATADIFLEKHGIGYVLISPKERESLQINEQFFQKFPVTAEVGEYKVYRVK